MNREEMVHWSFYLKGLDYPADRDAIVAQARRNDAPESLVNEFGQIPEKRYHVCIDVGRELGKLRASR